jgi:hypothetical protein
LDIDSATSKSNITRKSMEQMGHAVLSMAQTSWAFAPVTENILRAWDFSLFIKSVSTCSDSENILKTEQVLMLWVWEYSLEQLLFLFIRPIAYHANHMRKFIVPYFHQQNIYGPNWLASGEKSYSQGSIFRHSLRNVAQWLPLRCAMNV